MSQEHPLPPACPLVLVVDDDPALCDLLHRLLGQAGYRVECVLTGGAALARLEQGGIDLLLLDLLLPDLNGLEVCRQVRARDGAPYLPIIMLTGCGDAAQRHAGFVAGADDYVTKPFHKPDLLDRVQVWVQTGQRLQEGHARQQQLEAVRAEQARLEGVLLAARTLEHELNNALSRTSGYAQLLAADPALPPPLREAALAAVEGAHAASRAVEQLREVTQIQETRWGRTVGPTIDLARST